MGPFAAVALAFEIASPAQVTIVECEAVSAGGGAGNGVAKQVLPWPDGGYGVVP